MVAVSFETMGPGCTCSLKNALADSVLDMVWGLIDILCKARLVDIYYLNTCSS